MSDIIDEKIEKNEEKPLICTSVENNSALQARVNKVLKRLAMAFTVLGGVLVCGYIALATALETLEENGTLTVSVAAKAGEWVMLLIGGILLVGGIVLLVTAKNREKEAGQLATTNSFEFYSSAVVIRSLRCGEEISMVKLFYKDLAQFRYVENLLLLYPNSVTAYAVDLSKLTEEEKWVLGTIFPRKK